jgi:hypothetical protein
MKLLNIFLFCLVTMSAAIAAPGAHGPNGEHLDAPGGRVHGDAGPRIETFTESFELVGRLQDGELSVLIDRYDTNEPVLDGKLEVEFNGMKVAAPYHADHGDYAVDDENFLKALAKPGKHALLFTLTAGEDSDLLEGTLEVNAGAGAQGDAGDHGLPRANLTTWAIAGVLLAVLLVAIVMRQLRRKP